MKNKCFFSLLFVLVLSMDGFASMVDSVIIIPKTLTPLKEFNNDKLTFMDRNFGYGNCRYFDKPVSFLLEEMEREHPFYFVLTEPDGGQDCVDIVEIFFYSKEELKKMVKEDKEIWAVYTSINEFIKAPDPLYYEFQKIGIGKLIPWDRKKYSPVLQKITCWSITTGDLHRKVKRLLENE